MLRRSSLIPPRCNLIFLIQIPHVLERCLAHVHWNIHHKYNDRDIIRHDELKGQLLELQGGEGPFWFLVRMKNKFQVTRIALLFMLVNLNHPTLVSTEHHRVQVHRRVGVRDMCCFSIFWFFDFWFGWKINFRLHGKKNQPKLELGALLCLFAIHAYTGDDWYSSEPSEKLRLELTFET